jgi:pimeloyl-ACP methyl ester carboxylesterase
MQYTQTLPASAQPQSDELSAPTLSMLALEARAPLEFAALLASSSWLKKMPRGDGHPVLVFPGLGSGDLSTLALRRFLKDRGYKPYAWEQGLNLGPRPGVVEACEQRLAAIHDLHQRPVSLIGWSLGGVYAREIAKSHASKVRSVITLGSPFAGHPKATNALRFYKWVSGHEPDHSPEFLASLKKAPKGIPTTSIYSPTDGIVSWQCSLNDPGPLTENIAVPTSHMGLAFHPLALSIVADRLAQRPGQWKRFQPQGVSRWLVNPAHERELAPA